MTIFLQDIWPIKNLTDYKVHFTRWNGDVQPLEVWIRDKQEWQGWQEYRPGRDDFNRQNIISLIQFYLAGNHADIGGSYPENESRLSDITLNWMINFIVREIPEAGRVIIDPDLLKLYPSSDGMMHDECMVGVGVTGQSSSVSRSSTTSALTWIAALTRAREARADSSEL
jgi:hypothetical protein